MKTPIPFIDLKAQQDRIRPQLDAAIARVLDHGKYIMGPEVALLESELCNFVKAKHCISISNGTDALIAALMALEIGPGDAVITTPFTFFATVEAIMFVGATPVFADIDPATFNICPAAIEAAIRKTQAEDRLRLKAIMPVDLFGLCCDYDSINALANQHGLTVVQDAAQAFGASTPDARCAPSHGDIGTASFFPAKPLGCYGDGGACFTDNDDLAEKLRSIRVHGKGSDKYDNIRVGQNCRLDTIQAAILLEKLKLYSDEFERRQEVAGRYAARIDQLNESLGEPVIARQHILEGSQSAWAQFVIRHPHRDQISADLKEAGIPSVVYYRTPAHQLQACVDLPCENEFPVSEKVANSILALPFHPYLDESTIESIVGTIKQSVSRMAQA